MVNTEHPDVDQEAVSFTLFDHGAPFPRVLHFNTLHVYGRLAGCLPTRLIEAREIFSTKNLDNSASPVDILSSSLC